MRNSKIDKIKCKHRQRGKGWDEEFVSPTHVERVVQDPENDDERQRAVCKAIRSQLWTSVSLPTDAWWVHTFSRGKRCKNRPFSRSSMLITRSLLPAPEVTSTMSRLNAKGKNPMMANRYTRAHTNPIASGLYAVSN